MRSPSAGAGTRRGAAAGALAALSLALAVACAPSPPNPPPAPVAAPDTTAVVPAGSDLCYLTVAEAVKNPRLDVEQVPAPVKMAPPVFKPPYPRGVFGKGNAMELEFEVLVDTLGKADLSTFTVLKASNPWFVTQAKKAVAKWAFTPAVKTGCKVPRFYKLGISLGPKTGK
ncbi:MAG: hypothetical protein HYR75_05795 [Gemmatimonadetes bacterium]|nr:hypothetical protein [Gemmatimonadota bacterium]MBI3569184.1 hypothetical protein [Gemmatimonadota bacterium]